MEKILNKIYEGKIYVPKYNYEFKYSETHSILDLTYGEVTKEGINMIVDGLKKLGLFEKVHFLDIGSGNGRSVLHMGLYDNVISSNGIELLKSKVDYGIIKMKECDYPFKHKINFVADSWDNFQKIENLNKINLVIFNNICSSKTPPVELLTKLNKGTILVTVFGINNYKSIGFEVMDGIKSNYSWSPTHNMDTKVYKKIR
tara:strand:- start:309 stop:911 length:603 start_codon:yes stop_codon:yes gene_type:complete